MKPKFAFSLTILSLLFTATVSRAQKTTEQQVTKICTGLDASQKPIVAVMPFKVSAPGANNAVGTGLPDMLSNAILNAGCFRVVNRDRLNEIMQEQGLGLSGAVDENTAAQLGKLIGAQVMVYGTITKFKEDESGGGVKGGIFKKGGLLERAGALAGKLKSTTSLLGYTLQFVDANTAEVLDSKSFDEKVTSSGVAGQGAGINNNGAGTAGGSFYQNKSMEDAVEKSLIEAVEYMSQNKSAYANVLNNAKAAQENTAVSNQKSAGCPILQGAKKPSIVVIVPEEHVAGEGSNFNPYLHRVDITINHERNGMAEYISTAPCVAAETEISSKLTEGGFHLKDASQLEELKKEASYQNAYNNTDDASEIGSRYNIDLIIVGDAFSEYGKKTNGLISCRATVSIKAIMTKDGSIIASKSFKASGLDESEVIAGKTALEKAGTQIAAYLQQQFCVKGDDIVSAMNLKDVPRRANSNSANNTTQQNNANNSDYRQSAGNDKFASGNARDVTIQLYGLSYEQTKSITSLIEKTPGVISVKPAGFAMGQFSMKVNTVLSSDGLIQTIKSWNTRSTYNIQAATDEMIMMSIADSK
jgi:curli biogenesis system outer membrane secretion channel CsgG